MTRLREEDICYVGQRLENYDLQLFQRTGKGLAGIAAHALGKVPEDFAAVRQGISVGIVPIAYGQGIINGFSETLQDIIEFLGFFAFVTESPNISGLGEAISRGAKLIFLADDDKFVALNIASGKVSDNGEATGRGYAAALALMAGSVQGSKVLVIGAGPVGSGAALYLAQQGAQVVVHDPDFGKISQLRELIPGIHVAPKLDTALAECNLVLEATPAEDTIIQQYITGATRVAAPGIPLGLNPMCRELLAEHLVHDVLEIGVATMLFTALTE
ncbi:3-methylornithyl-N6-L-lysine dehydrogenase PylD [Sporomusa ovata DSM 2662]|uniref:Proline reductase for pyrrolysine biosynthesis n=1 Tax=Sporomusa ovata TaxID=2378 RepID=A0A0U1L1K6_9FIRM|nr:3-methylornithyl-N6-L-lysine dehydrogenase PylD [Sporomusa ovata]EQB27850.1 3-methylornithyl-N6-L-lysine dehydrogenase [Sporomusa ovata DSM 2662]CQR72784.1 Proline reductase for pyrrolysine biosynthesis [Sporomusa ovata]